MPSDAQPSTPIETHTYLVRTGHRGLSILIDVYRVQPITSMNLTDYVDFTVISQIYSIDRSVRYEGDKVIYMQREDYIITDSELYETAEEFFTEYPEMML